MYKSRRDLCFTLVLLAGLGMACNERRAVPPGPGGLPPVEVGKPNPKGMVHAPEGGGELPPGHPPTAAMPADHPPVLQGNTKVDESPAVPAVVDAASTISGVIKVSDKLKGKLKPGTVLFVMARTYTGGPVAGPPLAVKRLEAGTGPLNFDLTAGDVMLTGSKLAGKVVITVRADQDGDAMTKEKGDLEGQSAPFTVPQSKVEVTLDTERQQSTGAPSPPGFGGGGAMTPGAGGPGALPPNHP